MPSTLAHDSIVLLYDSGFKAAYCQENSRIIELPLNKYLSNSISRIISPEITTICHSDAIDQISALCGWPYVEYPAKKYLISSKLQVLNWDFMALVSPPRISLSFGMITLMLKLI